MLFRSFFRLMMYLSPGTACMSTSKTSRSHPWRTSQVGGNIFITFICLHGEFKFSAQSRKIITVKAFSQRNSSHCSAIGVTKYTRLKLSTNAMLTYKNSIQEDTNYEKVFCLLSGKKQIKRNMSVLKNGLDLLDLAPRGIVVA